MKITLRRTGGAALALSGLLALGACGSDGSPAEGTGTSGKADAARGDTVDAGEVAGRMVTAMEKAGSGTMTMKTGEQEAYGDFVYVDGKMHQHTTVPVEGSEMEIIAVGDFVYLKGLPGQSKPWVKIDPTSSDPISQMFKGIVEGGVSDPGKMATNLKGTPATVKAETGDTKTYEFTVDPAKALGSGATPPAGTGKLTMTYVLDKQDRPLKISTATGGQSIEVEYVGWGKKITIDAPPADEVGTLSIPSAG
ncbi:hypothetical protein Q9R29_10315 [Rothia sp. ARF10]|nr:hypothetical protein [Rothia sp. ARF10]